MRTKQKSIINSIKDINDYASCKNNDDNPLFDRKVEVTTAVLDGVNKEDITFVIINHLRKLDYIIVHADGKISINNIGKGHCNEEIILPENI